MGREIRKVPADWKHPKDDQDEFVGLHDQTYEESLAEEDYGQKPEWFREAFTSEPTHYQLYETVTEGTPMSPVFETKEELGDWMMIHPDPVWGQRSREAVDAFLESEWSISMMMIGGKVMDGMEAMVQPEKEK